MKEFIVSILFFLIFGFLNLYSQNEIDFNFGTTVIVDGVVSLQEWNDAESIEIQTAGDKIVTVYFKHDGDNMLFAFLNNLGSANFRFPEILLDINNDKSQQWMNDDWWFHVSNTNCFNRGAHSVYNMNTCKTVQPDWQANNFSVSLPDTVEIKIPFSFIGIDSSIAQIGIAFDVTNTYSAWEFYPIGAIMNTPETWTTGNIMKATSVFGDYNSDNFNFEQSPNPISDNTIFKYTLSKNQQISLIIYNLIGEKIETLVNEYQMEGNYEYSYDASGLEPGVYFYQFSSGRFVKAGMLIVNR